MCSCYLPTKPLLKREGRQTNLALLQNYGPNAWRVHNYLLEATAKNLEKELEENKQRTVEVNRERKNGQVCSKVSGNFSF